MLKRVWIISMLLALLAPAAAYAQPTIVGITLAGTHGTHRESGGSASAPLIPAPILSVSHRFNRFELSAEGLPPIGPIAVANNGLGIRNVALTYADATLRYWNASGTFAAGIGETLYNQRTHLVAYQDPFVTIHDTDMSRVVGVRYELTGRVRVSPHDFFEAQVAVDPRMHGRFAYNRRFSFKIGPSHEYTTRPIWETASQVDADARFVHAFGAYRLAYGVRYLNYAATFTGRPWSPFADANSLLMPYIGLERALGH